eukprot:TRINITY_DN15578_c0_g1_i1.p2 TRINITY_DN15578_c0_g1~~TRINITY_DN15578_c0_g1_i1.p2  ORF type:complete len:123 (-),score=26.64 TRINITY_DN15578_c0_g1_i1:602-970(-)
MALDDLEDDDEEVLNEDTRDYSTIGIVARRWTWSREDWWTTEGSHTDDDKWCRFEEWGARDWRTHNWHHGDWRQTRWDDRRNWTEDGRRRRYDDDDDDDKKRGKDFAPPPEYCKLHQFWRRD